LRNILTEELKGNKKLLEQGEGDSSSGSDSAPSDDNLNPEEIAKIIPILDKKAKLDLAKMKKKQQKDMKDSKSKRNLLIKKTKEEQPPAVQKPKIEAKPISKEGPK